MDNTQGRIAAIRTGDPVAVKIGDCPTVRAWLAVVAIDAILVEHGLDLAREAEAPHRAAPRGTAGRPMKTCGLAIRDYSGKAAGKSSPASGGPGEGLGPGVGRISIQGRG